MDLQTLTLFGGLSAVAVVYWLVQHARRNGYLKGGQAFLVTGLVWTGLVALFALMPKVAEWVLVALAGWAATLLFKAGAKDNERKPE